MWAMTSSTGDENAVNIIDEATRETNSHGDASRGPYVDSTGLRTYSGHLGSE